MLLVENGMMRRMGLSATITLTLALTLTSCALPTPTRRSATSGPKPMASVAAVSVDDFGQGVQDGPVDVAVRGPTRMDFHKITIKPGAGTGLHCHYGQLLAVVSRGVFMHYAPTYPTGVHQYVAGESIVEGASYVHEGKNEGTEDVTLWVTYVTPKGEPLAETDLAKCEPRRD